MNGTRALTSLYPLPHSFHLYVADVLSRGWIPSNTLSQDILERSLNDNHISLCRFNLLMTHYALHNASNDQTRHVKVLLLLFG